MLSFLLGGLQSASATLTGLSSLKVADSVLAAASLASSIWALHTLDVWGGLRPLTFFSAPMLSSAIIFFAGPTPPPPGTFVVGTLGAFLMGFSLCAVAADRTLCHSRRGHMHGCLGRMHR